MTQLTPIQTSFNAGEISERMGGRVDTSIYQNALALCENFVPTAEGPIVKRPGFEYIQPAAPTAAWLSTFKFNLTQEYALEWSDGKVRFFTNGARIETSPGVPYEVTVPYTAAEAAQISAQQNFDRLYLAHRKYPPAALRRTSGSTFAYEVLELKNGPFADSNGDETITLTVSATTGSGITITASSAIFAAGHVGSQFRIEAKDFSDVTAWDVGIDSIVIGNKRRSEGKVYEAETPGRSGTSAPIHTSGSEWDGSANGTDINGKGPFGIKWKYLYDRFGIVKITAIGGGGTTATADVVRRIPDSVVTVATSRWAHSVISNAAGWPNVVKVAFGRMVLFKDFDVIGSVSGDYGGGRVNFATFTSAGLVETDLAFRRTLSMSDPPLWVAGDRKLLVGTASGEFAIGPTNAGLAVSGNNISADPQGFYGSELVWPAQLGSSTFFVQRGGRKLREAEYDFARDRYVAPNVSIWARQITKSGILQFAYQKEPEELLFGVRVDGQLIVHPHQPEQEVKGFARIRHANGAGNILSAVSIVGADGKSDEIWALVLRDGARSVERMAAWRDDDAAIEASFFVDAGLTVTAAGGQVHFTGATHLAGKAVKVLAGGGVVPGITVAADGSFDIPTASAPASAYTLTVGLGFTATAVTLRPELKLNGQTSQNKRQRLIKIALRLLGTVGIKAGQFGGKLDNLIDRPADAHMDAPIPLFSGDSQKPVSGSFDRNGQAMFVSDDPLPCVIAAAMPKIEIAD